MKPPALRRAALRTLDPCNPQPYVYPECAGCATSYVLRRTTVMRAQWQVTWVWAADCKCKGPRRAKIVNERARKKRGK